MLVKSKGGSPGKTEADDADAERTTEAGKLKHVVRSEATSIGCGGAAVIKGETPDEAACENGNVDAHELIVDNDNQPPLTNTLSADNCDSPLRGGGSLSERPTPEDLSQGCVVPDSGGSKCETLGANQSLETNLLASAAPKADSAWTTNSNPSKPTRRLRGKTAPPTSGPRIRLTAKTKEDAANDDRRAATTLTRDNGPPAAREFSASTPAQLPVCSQATLQTNATSGKILEFVSCFPCACACSA